MRDTTVYQDYRVRGGGVGPQPDYCHNPNLVMEAGVLLQTIVITLYL